MGKQVEKILDGIQRSNPGMSRASAIRVAKANCQIHQAGRHLALGPPKAGCKPPARRQGPRR